MKNCSTTLEHHARTHSSSSILENVLGLIFSHNASGQAVETVTSHRYTVFSNLCECDTKTSTQVPGGYVAIHVEYTGRNWAGLERTDDEQAFLDGSSSSDSNMWWYAVGSASCLSVPSIFECVFIFL